MTNLNIVSAYVGSDQVEKIYLGADIVWERTQPTPPEPVLPKKVKIKYGSSDPNEPLQSTTVINIDNPGDFVSAVYHDPVSGDIDITQDITQNSGEYDFGNHNYGWITFEFPGSSIADGLFNGYVCEKIIDVIVYEGITEIGGYAFAWVFAATGLTFSGQSSLILSTRCFQDYGRGGDGFDPARPIFDLTLPSGTTYIGLNAFNNSGLRTLTMEGLVPPVLDNGEGCTFPVDEETREPNLTILVPNDALMTYCEASGWSDYESVIQ